MRACLFFAGLIVAAGGIAPAGGTALAEPQAPTLTEEQRRKLQERIIEQFEKAREDTGRAAPQASQPAQPAGAAPAAPTAIVQRPSIGSDQVQLSYDNADLYDFINQIADILHITPIVIDPEVKGTVTIHSSAPMPKEDVFPLFNLILKNNNAALVRQGNIHMIVPISSALKKGLEIIIDLPPAPKTPVEAPASPPGATPPSTAAPPARTPAAQPPPGAAQLPPTPAPPPSTTTPPQASPPRAAPQAPSSIVVSSPGQAAAGDARVPRLATHIIRAEFVPVRDLIEPIKLLMTEGGVIMPYDRLNMLIITDYSDSVSRIIDIIRLLDSSYLDPDLVELIKIKFNASADVLEDLRKIFGSGTKESPTGIYFVSLDRMNAILVMAPSKRALEEVKRWIARLDATTGRTLQTFVYTVENSTAANIAVILSALYGGEGTTTGEAATGRTTGASGAGAARSGGMTGGAAGTAGGGFQGGGGGVATPFGTFGGGGGGGGFQGGGGGFQQGGFGGGGGFFGGGQQLGPRLNPNAGMSSLALRGGGLTGLQEAVRIVVDDINNSLIIQASAADYAYIAEVIKKLDVMPRQVLIDARIFEIELTDTFSFGISAALQSRGTDPRLTTAKLASGGGITADTFAFIGNGREILMALDLLREKTKVRILEAPSILALDGTEAKIVVGGEVPYPAASFIPATGGSTSSIQYRETGVQLLVIPRISASGIVTLAIAQEVSSVGAPAEDGPTFNKSTVQTTFAVKDGETVAIAGLIRDSNNNVKGGIPFLSDIPLIGPLFGKFRRTVNRTELLILITPHVIRTPERFQEMTQDLKDSLRNVRKLVDEKQDEHLKDMEDARKDRYKREEKRLERKGDEPKDDKRPAIVTPPVKPPKEKKP